MEFLTSVMFQRDVLMSRSFALQALTNKDERAGQTYGGHEMYVR